MELLSISSIIVSLFSLFVSFYTSHKQIKSQDSNKKRDIYRDFTRILLEKRIEKYPELWLIVSSIYWIKKIGWLKKKWIEEKAVEINLQLRKKLQEWRKINGIFVSNINRLINFKLNNNEEIRVSISTLRALQKLEDSLYLKSKYSFYDDNKKKNIDKYRNILLKLIRVDLDIMERSGESINDDF